eukprot:TRINITY_DN16530_c0_g1_i1.p1 TRINITY_DN16530_c0_g1~~TRINITY_DN16530_c0_g1_i1.p1  ORF type:complete len:541 (+),score=220.91 TRINITY_DN16530_c0_g1_i1:36-1625(+)
MQVNAAAIAEAVKAYDLPEGVKFSYGTSGFRTVGELLPGVALRIGVLMCARSALKKQAVGVMVSASHNPAKDNGMKLVESTGEMLHQSWEAHAEEFANARSGSDLHAALVKLIESESIDTSFTPRVVVGSDTRETGPALLAGLKAGIEAVGGTIEDHKIVTTPQLHYFVHKQAEKPDEQHYVATVAKAFRTLMGKWGLTHRVHIDCCNGVGYPKMKVLAEAVTGVSFRLFNGDIETPAKLNNLCGADFIQKEKRTPEGADTSEFGERDHLAAFDGDADRLVYFFYKDGAFNILDGDRIAVLYATYVRKLIDELNIDGFAPKIGIVQTAYANGASTTYMQDVLKVEVAFTPTGVKHLHLKAVEYDVGVYFEANGHGTIVFSPAVLERLQQDDLKDNVAAQHLLAVSNLLSPVCGDAMTDLLFCEAALANMGWSIADWAQLYADAPSRMTKVTVPDPQRIKTTWNQMKTTAPEGLQDAIDAVVKDYNCKSRSFVRPSGTEPIVRVYAESDTQDKADDLASKVEDVVRSFLK